MVLTSLQIIQEVDVRIDPNKIKLPDTLELKLGLEDCGNIRLGGRYVLDECMKDGSLKDLNGKGDYDKVNKALNHGNYRLIYDKDLNGLSIKFTAE